MGNATGETENRERERERESDRERERERDIQTDIIHMIYNHRKPSQINAKHSAGYVSLYPSIPLSFFRLSVPPYLHYSTDRFSLSLFFYLCLCLSLSVYLSAVCPLSLHNPSLSSPSLLPYLSPALLLL
jgi:hypothetical protein